jgi:hypothetical protein
VILRPEWHCPNCGKRAHLPVLKPGQTHFHTCPKLRGLSAPLLPAGVRAKVEAREREDYIGGEKVALDPERKRPVMSIVTTRDNGQDVAVFAPTATGKGH